MKLLFTKSGLFPAALLLLALQAIAVPASANARAQLQCSSHGPIPVNTLPSKISLRECPIQDRLLVVMRPDGRTGVGIHIPRAGMGIGGAALTTNGEYVLTATNAHGTLSIHWSAPPAHPQRASRDPACKENAFNYEGPLWANTGIPTDVWFYNESTASRAGLGVSATTSDIKQAATNMTHGINNCGFAEGGFNVQNVFKGNTGKFANVTSAAKCSSNFPDGQNTVSFGPFDSSHPNTLAVTCIAFKTDSNGTEAMVEADTYIGSNRHMVDKFPSRCTNSFDLQSTMTHEFGHAFGMDHETSGTHEVMYPFESPCALRRHLGGGDWSGMAGLYP